MTVPDEQSTVVQTPTEAPRWRRDVVAALRVLRLAVLVGIVVGVVWWRVAPRVMVEVTADSIALVDPAGKAFIATDGWFAVLAAVAGLVCGVVGVLRWRRDGIGLAVGEAVGGLVGALVAMLLGQWLGRASIDEAAVGAVVEASLRVRATGVLLAWPLVALLIVVAVAVSFGLDDAEDDEDDEGHEHHEAPTGPDPADVLSPGAPPEPRSPTSG